MEAITYNGIDYPTRTFDVITDDGADMTITIANQDLLEAIEDGMEVEGSEEEAIDTQIYFYVDNDLFDLDPVEICDEHLDESMEFVTEYENFL